MPVRAVVDIDINDEALKSTVALIQKYREELNKLPGGWGSVSRASGAARGNFVDMAAIMVAQLDVMLKMERSLGGIDRAVASTGRGMTSLSRSTRDVARHIEHATTSLLKWTGVTTALSGLVGLGGLFGIERLAQSATQQRMGAIRAGTTQGNLSALEAIFGPIGADVRGSVGRIATAQQTPGQSWIFNALGVPGAQRQDPGDAFLNLARAAGQMYNRTDPNFRFTQMSQVTHATELFSFEDIRAFAAMVKSGEFNKFAEEVQKAKDHLKLKDEDLSAWMRFRVQLNLAGQTIENAFIKGLSGLTPQLTRLSGAFSHMVEQVLKSDQLKYWVDMAAGGLEKLADWLIKPEFEKSRQEFADNVTKFVTDVVGIATSLGDIALSLGSIAKKMKILDELFTWRGLAGAAGLGRGSLQPDASKELLPPGSPGSEEGQWNDPISRGFRWIGRHIGRGFAPGSGGTGGVSNDNESGGGASHASIIPDVGAAVRAVGNWLFPQRASGGGSTSGRSVGAATRRAANDDGAGAAAVSGDTGSFIRRQEGLSLREYNDVGHRAIGYGHDITPREASQGFIQTPSGPVSIGSGRITKEQADAIFAADYSSRRNRIAQQIPGFDRLNVNQQEAIMSYYYNTGRLPRGLASNMQSGNLPAVAESIRTGIATVHGQPFAPLIRRRREEAALFNKPSPIAAAVRGTSGPADRHDEAASPITPIPGAVSPVHGSTSGTMAGGVRLEIHNQTGGGAAITTSQIAA